MTRPSQHPQPNPKNCGTCNDIYCEAHPSCPEDLAYFGRKEIQEFTKFKGCASHSNAQSERDKVLDELHKLALKEAKERSIKEGGLAFVSVQVWIEQLRSKAGDRK
jgi:hypothetical protein